MNLLLSLKHWHIFIYFVLLIIINSNFEESSVKLGDNKSIDYIFYLISNSVMILSYVLINNFYIIKMANYNENKFNNTSRNLILLSLIHTFVIISFSILMIFENDYLNSRSSEWIVWFLFLPYVYTIFLNYFYAAKVISIFSKILSIKPESFAFYVLAFVFYPLGIWFIQPKVNKLANELGRN